MDSKGNQICTTGRCGGPGYATPLDAFQYGPRETLLYVTCVRPERDSPDYLATVDVDPGSYTYGQVLHRTFMPTIGDELHHSGWNTCSSCHGKPGLKRDKLVLPCLQSSRIHVLHVDRSNTRLFKTIQPEQLAALDLSVPHTSHCLPSGQVMISCMGDANGQGKGNFLLLDGTTFDPIGLWNYRPVPFGYDFWYQPRFDVLISTEWGSPKAFQSGFQPEHVANNQYGHSIHVWRFSSGELIQSIDLRSTGKPACMPLEIRFLHRPDAAVGYVGCAHSGNVFRFWRDPDGWKVQQAIAIPAKQVVDGDKNKNDLPPLITDILISLDDQMLFVSAWGFGEIRLYDIGQNPVEPPLRSIVRLGGLLMSCEVVHDPEPVVPESQIHRQVRGITVQGGSQMLQLSLDGRRLYVTNSLYSVWDRQFYPEMIKRGSQLLKVNVNPDKTLTLDQEFLVDFGKEPNGPALAHEMRYPGGDCTSDIWI